MIFPLRLVSSVVMFPDVGICNREIDCCFSCTKHVSARTIHDLKAGFVYMCLDSENVKPGIIGCKLDMFVFV